MIGPSIRLPVPAVVCKVFIEYQPLSGDKQHFIVETRNRLKTPPFVVDAPPVFNGLNSLPPRCTDRKRQTGGVFFYIDRFRDVYRPVGISA
jgi:hypothetical protein